MQDITGVRRIVHSGSDYGYDRARWNVLLQHVVCKVAVYR